MDHKRLYGIPMHYFYIDTVLPIRNVFYRVAANELSSPDGAKFR